MTRSACRRASHRWCFANDVNVKRCLATQIFEGLPTAGLPGNQFGLP